MEVNLRVRAITSEGEWTFGKGKQSYKVDEEAIAQNVKTRVMSFLGDCFFDMKAGIDWLNLLDTGRRNDLLRSIQLTILGTEGVVAINSVDYYTQDRKLVIIYDIKTVFSSSYSGNLTTDYQ